MSELHQKQAATSTGILRPSHPWVTLTLSDAVADKVLATLAPVGDTLACRHLPTRLASKWCQTMPRMHFRQHAL